MNLINEKNKIDKSYKLITARYKLSTVEQKLVLSIISLIRPTDSDFMNYQIPVSQFEFLTSNDNARRLKKYCKDLMSKPLEIETERGWTLFNWFAHIEYIKNDGMLECSVSPKLKPYLLELKENFKSYDLKYVLEMQSEYSIRIYELLKKSEKMGYLEINLEELQDFLQVPESFKRYDNFKRKVLQVTSIEIAKYSDIYFEFEEIKKGKKVAILKFIIHKNKHNLIADEDYQFKKFREHITKEYEGLPILFHPKIERHIMIQNGLLTIEESGTIIKSERALELWNFIYKNQKLILAKPML
ncbi:MAG: RepB family plasmid replication initiator protein [Erysipelotrichia bacterium]|nr:RepB family plasmid replication initiator protein [Erysipelotrichia bacterium]